jgi:stage V sporulation protein D (sporulation-specific penicillin-binding protein)
VVGLSASAANEAMTNAGLIMKVAGTTSTASGSVRAISQDTAAGAQIAAGSVVTVRFGDSSVLD